jgi:hypothetical protein
VFEVVVGGVEPPEGGVGAVVLGRFAFVGEAIGDEAGGAVGGKGFEQGAGVFGEGLSAEEEAREGDEGIAAPVGKPGEAGEKGPGAGGAAGEEIGGWVAGAAQARFVGGGEVSGGAGSREARNQAGSLGRRWYS